MTNKDALKIANECIEKGETIPEAHNYSFWFAVRDALALADADGCVGCTFIDREEWEMPCKKCKRCCNDYWRGKNE